MNCEDCQDRLIEYVHEEVERDESNSVATHLADCSECALEYCRLRADIEGIARAYSEAPDAGVADALRRRVEEAFAPPWWRQLGQILARPIPIYGAAAAAALPLLVWFATEYAPPKTAEVERPATVIDYDATAPLQDRSIL